MICKSLENEKKLRQILALSGYELDLKLVRSYFFCDANKILFAITCKNAPLKGKKGFARFFFFLKKKKRHCCRFFFLSLLKAGKDDTSDWWKPNDSVHLQWIATNVWIICWMNWWAAQNSADPHINEMVALMVFCRAFQVWETVLFLFLNTVFFCANYDGTLFLKKSKQTIYLCLAYGHMPLVHSGSFATFGSANPHLHDARAQREVFVVTVTFYLEIFPLIKEAIRSIRAVETAAHDSMSSGITWTLSCFPER